MGKRGVSKHLLNRGVLLFWSWYLDLRGDLLTDRQNHVSHFHIGTRAEVIQQAVDQIDGDFNFLVLHGFLLVVNEMPGLPKAKAIVPELD